MNSPSTLKTFLLSVWLLLVVAVIVAITNQDKFFAMELRPVATLAQRAGTVMARPEGQVRWREVVGNQSFYDGDRVATGPDSRSTVRFDAKRKLQLGEDTQVQITSIRQGDGGLAFMIKLFRGTMEAETDGACPECPPLILRDDGGETYNVVSGRKIALQKVVGKKAQTFDAKIWPVTPKAERPRPIIAASFVKIAKVDPAEQVLADARLKQEQEERERQAASDLAAKEKERKDKENAAKGAEPLLAASVDGQTLWTMAPLSSLGATLVDVPFTPPARRPDGWRPLLELSGGGKTPVIIEGDAASFKIPVDRIRRVAVVTRSGGLAEYVFSVRAGARAGKDKAQSFAAQRAEMRVKSLGEVGGAPVTVALDGLKPASNKGPSPWLAAKAPLTVAAAPVAVSLASGDDYAKLAPFIESAVAVGLSRESIGGDGVFVVRDRAVVAQVKGAQAARKATAGAMMRALGGEFVFKGGKAALYDARGQAQTALVDGIGALLDKGKVLYVLKKNKLYPVSRDFIKTNSEVAAFIDTQARAIFLERVEIVDYR